MPVVETPTETTPERISIDEVLRMQRANDPVVFVDARAARSYAGDDRQIAGSVRVPPDDPVRTGAELRLSQRATLVVYCA